MGLFKKTKKTWYEYRCIREALGKADPPPAAADFVTAGEAEVPVQFVPSQAEADALNVMRRMFPNDEAAGYGFLIKPTGKSFTATSYLDAVGRMQPFNRLFWDTPPDYPEANEDERKKREYMTGGL